MKTIRCVVIVFGLVCSFSAMSSGQRDDLSRRAFLGFSMTIPNGASFPKVASVKAGSPASEAGLKVGDLVLSLNGKVVSRQMDLEEVLGALRGGTTLQLQIQREGRRFGLKIGLAEHHRESFQGAMTIYGSVLSPRGYRVRTLITYPTGSDQRLPGIFLAPWLSCDSVEMPDGPGSDGMLGLLHALATRSGYVTMRVERPGLGDSQGPPCSEADFYSELDAYRAAFKEFRRSKQVDTERIFVLGLSNGGGYAPLVVEGQKVAGIIPVGGWVKSWFQHMLEHGRRSLGLTGENPREIGRRMKGFTEFYYRYLVMKKTPGQVIRERPDLAKLWYDLPGHQYGRAARYFHQLQELDLIAEWDKVTAPVLTVWGSHDWIMSREDHEIIAEMANKKRPGNGRFIELPRTTHNLIQKETDDHSFENFRTGSFNSDVVELILEWMRDVNARAASSDIRGKLN